MADVDLNFLAEQLRRLIVKVDSLSDDSRVMTAMMLRHDHGLERHQELLADMLREIRAMNQQQARLSDRVERLEGAST
jgi:hypothetical protein